MVLARNPQKYGENYGPQKGDALDTAIQYYRGSVMVLSGSYEERIKNERHLEKSPTFFPTQPHIIWSKDLIPMARTLFLPFVSVINLASSLLD
jgi:hypothetical protein